VCPFDANRIEELSETVRPVGDREWIRRVGGSTGTRGIPGEDPEPIGEIRELRFPHPRVAEEPVEKDQRRAAPGLPVRDGVIAHPDAGDVGVTHSWVILGVSGAADLADERKDIRLSRVDEMSTANENRP